MKYDMLIGCSSTCPMKETVLKLVDEKKATFKTVVGQEQVRGKFPLFVDSNNKDSMYGMINKVMDANGNILDPDTLKTLIAQKPQVVIISRNANGANILKAEMVIDDVKTSNVEKEYKPSAKLKEVMDQKIAEGILTQEEMDERIAIMAKNKVDEALKIRVVKSYRKYNKNAHKPRCIYVDPYIDKIMAGDEGIIAEGLRNAVSRMATICEGEKSVGKNVYMETIAWLLGMPLYMITFSRNMNPNSVYGEKSTDNSASERLGKMHEEAAAYLQLNKDMPIRDMKKCLEAAKEYQITKDQASAVNIVIDSSELYDWMIDGGVMVFNEMNMAESNFFSSFANPLTDGTGFLFIPGRGEVKLHDDCVLFGTQNADYEGTLQQNEATMSRFNTLYFQQPESILNQLKAATKAELIKDGITDYDLPEKYYIQTQKFYEGCRKAVVGESNIDSAVISNAVLNIRGFVRALTVVAESEASCKLSRWIEICVINTCPSDERPGLKHVLKSIITL